MRIFLALAFCLWTGLALAQGCGNTNPNCVVPLRPIGDNTNAAASTAFISQGVTIPTNNTSPSISLQTPNTTNPACGTSPCAALFIDQPTVPSTQAFVSGIWLKTDAATTDHGRGIIVSNNGASDGIYIQNDGVGATGLASLLTTNNTGNGVGAIIGTTLSPQLGLVVRQETAINPSAGSAALVEIDANGSATEMLRIQSTVASQNGIVFRMTGANCTPIVGLNPGSTQTFLVNCNGGILSGANGGASGILIMNGSTSGQAQVFATAIGQLGLIGNGGQVFVESQGGSSGQLNIVGATSGSVGMTASATGGHLSITSSSTPTLTAGCNGAGSAVSGTDAAGTITGSTAAATTCTLTFGTAYASAPNCVASGQNSPLTGAFTPSTSTLVVNFASTANFKWSYICSGV